MKNSVKVLFGLAVVAAWLTGVVIQAQQQEHQTLEGTVSNTHCGLKHANASASPVACVNACITGQGAKYALVSGGKVITLDGMSDQLAKLAGMSAKVTGHLAGTTMKVEKVEAGGASSGGM